MRESPLAIILGSVNAVNEECKYGEVSFRPALLRMRAYVIEEFIRHFKEQVPNAREYDLRFLTLLLTQLANNSAPDRTIEHIRAAAVQVLKLRAVQDAPLESVLLAIKQNKLPESFDLINCDEPKPELAEEQP